ncbi:hypothetical protein ACHAW5_000226 [Stephanodiscus triporus]|uniref:Uncharacterized protein n=1 Tax=Stephanodiscus triporus TaxID=2934178 RepID=A0ABD3QQF3_9STRA
MPPAACTRWRSGPHNTASEADGVQLYSEDGSDYQLIAQSYIPGGPPSFTFPPTLSSPPAMSSTNLEAACSRQRTSWCRRQACLPLFRLMVKILSEYDAGQDSPFYPGSIPCQKQFYNDVSMTDACFACLPPYAGWLYTLNALKQHVYSILADVEQLTMTAQSYDLRTHPRVPVIVAHNSLVRDTFTMTAALLEQMG